MKIRYLFILAFFTLIISFDSDAMETLFPSSKVTEKDAQQCSSKIAEFKSMARDAKQCMRDADCTIIQAGCPLSCRYAVNVMFVPILEGLIEGVHDQCDHSICSSRCVPKKLETDCKNGLCIYIEKK